MSGQGEGVSGELKLWGMLLSYVQRGARSPGGRMRLHRMQSLRVHVTPTVNCCISSRVSKASRIISCCFPHLSSVASVNQVTDRSQGQLLALTSRPGHPVTEPRVSLLDASGKYQGGQRPRLRHQRRKPWGRWTCHRDKFLNVYEA